MASEAPMASKAKGVTVKVSKGKKFVVNGVERVSHMLISFYPPFVKVVEADIMNFLEEFGTDWSNVDVCLFQSHHSDIPPGAAAISFKDPLIGEELQKKFEDSATECSVEAVLVPNESAAAVANTSRRPSNPFSEEETNALVDLLPHFAGSWAKMLDFEPFRGGERSCVDLKDKAKNLYKESLKPLKENEERKESLSRVKAAIESKGVFATITAQANQAGQGAATAAQGATAAQTAAGAADNETDVAD